MKQLTKRQIAILRKVESAYRCGPEALEEVDEYRILARKKLIFKPDAGYQLSSEGRRYLQDIGARVK